MSFSAEWLALREPIDHAARDEAVLNAVKELMTPNSPTRITDIGSGTGSSVRALRPVLTHQIYWRLVDNDEALLAKTSAEMGADKATIIIADVSQSLDAIFEKPSDLLTTSAFLDLVSEDWLKSFVQAVCDRRLPFYAALTYDGRAGLIPPLEEDEFVLAAFNAHQKTNKGFGPALGRDAAETAIDLFREAGYEVTTALSDWHAGSLHPDFQKTLLDGWRIAASEIRPDQSETFEKWYQQRLELIAHGASIFVGHMDFLAAPSSNRITL